VGSVPGWKIGCLGEGIFGVVRVFGNPKKGEDVLGVVGVLGSLELDVLLFRAVSVMEGGKYGLWTG
jgi:hypothetical protein